MTRSRRILGVDPGTRRAGWAVVAGSIHAPELMASGAIALPSSLPLAARLARLHGGISEIVSRFAPTEAAVEAPFHGISARSALQLAHARGAVLAALGSSGVPVSEYSPATVKKAVTGNGRAEKAQVDAMVSRLVRGAAPTGGSDAADALAAALCHLSSAAFQAALVATRVARRQR